MIRISRRNKKNFFNNSNSNSSYRTLNINKSKSLNNLINIPKTQSKKFNLLNTKINKINLNSNEQNKKKTFYKTLTKSNSFIPLFNKKNVNYNSNNNYKPKFFMMNNNLKNSRTINFNKSESFFSNNYYSKKNKSKPTTIFQKIINNINKVEQLNEITKIFLKEKIDNKKILFKNKNNSIYKKIKHQKIKNSKFPSMNLNTISTDSQINNEPLFENKNKSNYNSNLFHNRKLFISNKEKINFLYVINKNQNSLKLKNLNNNENSYKINTIKDKINLIFDNLSYFKMKYINKKSFKEAFYNSEEKIKGKFNRAIEIFCGLLIEISPYLIGNFNESINDILFVKKPDLKENSKLKIENENICLKINLKLLNDVQEYFTGIFEIFNIIQKKVIDFNYNENDYFIINLNLDIARYYSSFFYIYAQNYINKFEKDKKILDEMEIGLKLKKYNSQKENLKISFNEVIEEKNKINRINNVLKNDIEIRHKFIRKKIKQQKSILNSSILLNLLKYIKTIDKNKIISNIVLNKKLEEKNDD